jgi:hypothetical protein
MTEYFETGSKKGRGMARRSLDLIEAMYAAAEHRGRCDCGRFANKQRCMTYGAASVQFEMPFGLSRKTGG